MNPGVIYYNRGPKMLVRLAVSLSSLRKHYQGPVTILSHGGSEHAVCQQYAARWGAGVSHIEYPDDGKKQTYLNATLSHLHTPYDPTIWLDSDTLVRGDFADDLWAAANENEFAVAQISSWTTYKGKIASRIRAWTPVYPDWIQAAIDFGPAINCGVFAFRRDSKLMRDWYGLAETGRGLSMIPDETCCQLILPRYPHKIMDQKYNVSCKHSKPFDPDARIIHYHGRKHCRINEGQYLNGCQLWYEQFTEVRYLPEVKKYIEADRQLRINLGRWDGTN